MQPSEIPVDFSVHLIQISAMHHLITPGHTAYDVSLCFLGPKRQPPTQAILETPHNPTPAHLVCNIQKNLFCPEICFLQDFLPHKISLYKTKS